jgi:hypothetical protein
MKLKNTTKSTIVASIIGLLVGAILILFGQSASLNWLRVLLTHTGSFVIASVAMALIFQFWQIKGLLEDLLSVTRWSEQIEASGISGFSTNFHDSVQWDQLFDHKRSNRLNIMFAYASTWRNAHQQHLEEFLSDGQAKVEVVLPDPEVTVVMEEMAFRFGMNVDELKSRVLDALSFFKNLGDSKPGSVRVYYIPKSLTFSFYRFNNHAVLASYRHRPNRGSIMTLTAERGGDLYGWIREEWYGIVGNNEVAGIAKEVYSSENQDIAAQPG